MTDTALTTVLARLATRPLGTVLLLGTDSGALLRALPLDKIERVVSTEPDPRQESALQRQYRHSPSVSILPGMVGETPEPAKLRHFNLAQATALRAPTGLRSLFPGLRETAQADVHIQTVEMILQDLDLERGADHALVLATAGEEMVVIEQLAQLGMLQRFTHLITPLPSVPLYEGSATGTEIRARLETAGFRIEYRDDADPDMPVAHMHLDSDLLAARDEVSRLEAEHEKVAKERDAARQAQVQATQKAETLATEIASLREKLQETQAERDQVRQHLDTAKAESDRRGAEHDKVAKERDAARQAQAQATQKAETHATEIASLREKLQETQAERDQVRQHRATVKAEVERLRTAHEQAVKERDAARQAQAQAAQKAETLATEIEALREKLQETQTERDQIRQHRDAVKVEADRRGAEHDKVAKERDAARQAHTQATQKAETLEAEITSLRETLQETRQENTALRQRLEEAEQSTQTAQAEKERIRLLSDTYRHAIRLEVHRAARHPGQARKTSPAGLQFLEALDAPSSDVISRCLDTPNFKLDVFRKASEEAAARASHHVVLDVKSVPRSGLHYMKRQFAHLLQDRFSFCEWYYEPGCCKRMPCAHFPNAEDTGAGGSLRMLKSHDFDLTDPVYPVTPGVQRLILTRDPLFVLTSRWLLELLAGNQKYLKAQDIRIEKLFYLHEPAMLAQAYAALDNADLIPDEQNITTWLAGQQTYLTGFSEKWAAAAKMPRTYIVPYHKTPLAIEACLAPIRDALSEEQRARLEGYMSGWKTNFTPRQDPFKGPTPYLTTLLERHAALFRRTAEAVQASDTAGLFSGTG